MSPKRLQVEMKVKSIDTRHLETDEVKRLPEKGQPHSLVESQEEKRTEPRNLKPQPQYKENE